MRKTKLLLGLLIHHDRFINKIRGRENIPRSRERFHKKLLIQRQIVRHAVRMAICDAKLTRSILGLNKFNNFLSHFLISNTRQIPAREHFMYFLFREKLSHRNIFREDNVFLRNKRFTRFPLLQF